MGLSTAAAIKEKSPETSVLLIDRGAFPTGASVKNAGFACFGSLSELLDDLQHCSEEEMVQLVVDRNLGLQLLKNRLGLESLEYYNFGGYELITEAEQHCIEKLDYINALLYPLFSKNVFCLASDEISSFGFNKSMVKDLVFNSFEGQLNSGKMMKSLLEYVGALGVQRISAATVTSYTPEDEGVIVDISLHGEEKMKLHCDSLAICTNGFAKQLLPLIELQPGRGQVLITKPIPELRLKGTFHYDRGYYYFRNVGKRLMFGGGRQLDYQGETTTEDGLSSEIQQALEQILREVILPDQKFEIESRWSGIMAFGKQKSPICKEIEPGIFIGLRLGGMGVALGSKVGTDLAELMTRNT